MLSNLPQQRNIDGPTGTSLKEIRSFLSSIRDTPLFNGLALTIIYSAADVAGSVIKRIPTGLGQTPTGFFITRGHNGAGLIESAPPSTELDNTVLYLRATVAGTYTLWVF